MSDTTNNVPQTSVASALTPSSSTTTITTAEMATSVPPVQAQVETQTSPEKKEAKCAECGKELGSDKTAMLRHLKEHQQTKPNVIKCFDCKRTVPIPKGNRVDGGEDFICSMCQERFYNRVKRSEQMADMKDQKSK